MVKLFGTTIKETVEAFRPAHLDGGQSESPQEDRVKAIGRLAVTLILLVFAIVLIFRTDSNDLGNTIIGAVMGYWLK